jgi:hypothetical protein
MQIACKRFGCQKAVEVCYWTCKHRKNCKDWTGALDGQPGLVAITERLEMAAAKTGRVFEAKTLVKPSKVKRAATAALMLATATKTEPQSASIAMAHAVAKVAPQAVRKPVTNGTSHKSRPVKLAVQRAQPERKVMAKPEDEKIESTTEVTTPKANGTKPTTKPIAKPKAPINGTVYLLLGKNGKYKELREADLLKEAAHIFKDPSLRLVKGTYLVPQITFKSLDD